MSDIINLLPDNIANQIAAGEVIQRPASVVKELVENSIDAGSDAIKIIIKDAGRTLIEIADNGCGMSETDARMSFERHATSKIKNANDLFSIRTMGFRGEALASVSAVAQIELMTKRQIDEMGTLIKIEGSKIVKQEVCQTPVGTRIQVKNLFFNIPARRKFLKSDKVEMKYILDDFERVALANPEIFFSLHHNGKELFHLPKSNLKQRVVGVLGTTANKKLIPIQEDTEIVRFHGFVGKPEFTKKTRGEQFLFVNNRFIKSAYLHHAIKGAYEDIIADDRNPLYVIFLDIDPSRIDINVHPTKTEIKFDDEKAIYNYLKVAVRHSLGQYSLMPTLDFDNDDSILDSTAPFEGEREVNINKEMGYLGLIQGGSQKKSPSSKSSSGSSSSVPSNFGPQKESVQNWQMLYEGLERDAVDIPEPEEPQSMTFKSKMSDEDSVQPDSTLKKVEKLPYQIHNKYVISQIKSGFILINQTAAHERILYEKFLSMMEEKTSFTQKILFPETIEVTPSETHILKEIIPELIGMGFDIREFGKDSFVIQGIPSGLENSNSKELIETLLEQYKNNISLNLNMRENAARSLAKSAAMKRNKHLSIEEMNELIDGLFSCIVPYTSPSGKKCFITYDLEDLDKEFQIK